MLLPGRSVATGLMPGLASSQSPSHTVYPSPSASVDETGEYLPPVFSAARSLPPQMSISLPVQTAEWALRGSGALRVEVELHLSPAGSYAPPVSRQCERSDTLSLIHISEPTRLLSMSYA